MEQEVEVALRPRVAVHAALAIAKQPRPVHGHGRRPHSDKFQLEDGQFVAVQVDCRDTQRLGSRRRSLLGLELVLFVRCVARERGRDFGLRLCVGLGLGLVGGLGAQLGPPSQAVERRGLFEAGPKLLIACCGVSHRD
jgi:hypothetical protein